MGIFKYMKEFLRLIVEACIEDGEKISDDTFILRFGPKTYRVEFNIKTESANKQKFVLREMKLIE